MSSTNKTENLKLNSWLGSDIPKREDFNNDNEIIDSVVTEHTSDENVHITKSERNQWNEPYHIFTYVGNGESSRTLSTNWSVEAQWGFVYAVGKTPSVIDIENEADYNYFSIISQYGSTPGVVIAGKFIKLTQSTTAVNGNEYRNFNESGVTYVCVLFR